MVLTSAVGYVLFSAPQPVGPAPPGHPPVVWGQLYRHLWSPRCHWRLLLPSCPFTSCRFDITQVFCVCVRSVA